MHTDHGRAPVKIKRNKEYEHSRTSFSRSVRAHEVCVCVRVCACAREYARARVWVYRRWESLHVRACGGQGGGGAGVIIRVGV